MIPTTRIVVAAVAVLALVPAAADAAVHEEPLASTYSIVARDLETGDFGIAVQSHWFQVGALVPWAESGVGAVATQAFANLSFGPRGLDLLRQGRSAGEVLERLLAEDPGREQRQVAILDAKGRFATFTGERCIPAAGHLEGEGYSVQANLVADDRVWKAMARAFEQSTGDLAGRLLAALEAAEAVGGDRRGRQSAALLVVRGASTGQPWQDRFLDLRVDDHPQPLAELRRLLDLHRAYAAMTRASQAATAERRQQALDALDEVRQLAPLRPELLFWPAVTLFLAGYEETALPLFREIFILDPRWTGLLLDLPGAGLFPDDEALLERILDTAPAAARPADAAAAEEG